MASRAGSTAVLAAGGADDLSVDVARPDLQAEHRLHRRPGLWHAAIGMLTERHRMGETGFDLISHLSAQHVGHVSR
jgi:hypothetical protein